MNYRCLYLKTENLSLPFLTTTGQFISTNWEPRGSSLSRLALTSFKEANHYLASLRLESILSETHSLNNQQQVALILSSAQRWGGLPDAISHYNRFRFEDSFTKQPYACVVCA